MKKVLIDDCEDCPFVWWYLGTTECCALNDKNGCHTEEEMQLDVHIPDWCPLPTAKQDAVEAQKRLTTAKGMQYE